MHPAHPHGPEPRSESDTRSRDRGLVSGSIFSYRRMSGGFGKPSRGRKQLADSRLGAGGLSAPMRGGLSQGARRRRYPSPPSTLRSQRERISGYNRYIPTPFSRLSGLLRGQARSGKRPVSLLRDLWPLRYAHRSLRTTLPPLGRATPPSQVEMTACSHLRALLNGIKVSHMREGREPYPGHS